MFKSQKPENFDQLVDRIASGELTRAQAAAEAGLNPSTFTGWLTRTKAIDKLKHTRLSAGENSKFSNTKKDPDKAQAYKDAVAYVLGRPKYSLFSIWKREFPQLGYEHLRQLVIKAKQSEPDRLTAKVLEQALQQRANP